jgi:hypothetical protein
MLRFDLNARPERMVFDRVQALERVRFHANAPALSSPAIPGADPLRTFAIVAPARACSVPIASDHALDIDFIAFTAVNRFPLRRNML